MVCIFRVRFHCLYIHELICLSVWIKFITGGTHVAVEAHVLLLWQQQCLEPCYPTTKGCLMWECEVVGLNLQHHEMIPFATSGCIQQICTCNEIQRCFCIVYVLWQQSYWWYSTDWLLWFHWTVQGNWTWQTNFPIHANSSNELRIIASVHMRK